jgi:hypothetical protein
VGGGAAKLYEEVINLMNEKWQSRRSFPLWLSMNVHFKTVMRPGSPIPHPVRLPSTIHGTCSNELKLWHLSELMMAYLASLKIVAASATGPRVSPAARS